MRKEVQWFAEQMEKTLCANDHKGGWGKASFRYLYSRLALDESPELLEAIKNLVFENHTNASQKRIEELKNNVIKEATDVANFAMMIADNASKI